MGASTRLPLLLLLCLTWLASLATSHHHSDTDRGPIQHISLVENIKISTPSNHVHWSSKFDLDFTVDNGKTEVKLKLEPNYDLITDDTVVEYMDEHGNIERKKKIKRNTHRVFKGTSWLPRKEGDGWRHAGWARIYINEDGDRPLFDGLFTLDHEIHNLVLKSQYLKYGQPGDVKVEDSGEDYVLVYRGADIGKDLLLQARSVPKASCGTDALDYNLSPQNPARRSMAMQAEAFNFSPASPLINLFKRQNDIGAGGRGSLGSLTSTIGSTAGCPATKRVALVGVASDCNYAKDFEDQEAAEKNIIRKMQQASQLFESTFNINLGLRSLLVSNSACPGTPPPNAAYNIPCSAGIALEERLSIFSEWRGNAPRKDDGNAFWTLMTKCTKDDALGIAWLGLLCMQTAEPRISPKSGKESVISGVNVVARVNDRSEWKVLAHEIGHTFGAVHDCTSGPEDIAFCSGNLPEDGAGGESRCCPLSRSECSAQGQYIMNPRADDQLRTFSPCSVGNICSALGRFSTVDSSCLVSNRDVTVLTENVCGNGIVEAGEDCDCGGEEGCAGNTCCDPKTCKFTSGSVCDDSNEECCSGCQFRSSDSVCRESHGPCDPEERCTGDSGMCPEDKVEEDGKGCGDGLHCASGQCTSRNLQCQTMMADRIQFAGNSTEACDDSACRIECKPSANSRTCFTMNQFFLDGTRCNSDGRCVSGRCVGASALGGVRAWIDRNRTVVIVVASVVGALVLFSLLSCIWTCIKRRRRGKAIREGRVAPRIIPMPNRFVSNAQANGTNLNQTSPMAHQNDYAPPPYAPPPAAPGMGPRRPSANRNGAPPMPPRPQQSWPAQGYETPMAARYG